MTKDELRKHKIYLTDLQPNEFVRNKIDSKEFVDKRMVKRIFKNEAKEYIIDKLISKIFEKYRNELGGSYLWQIILQ